jgi:hypothetical protein
LYQREGRWGEQVSKIPIIVLLLFTAVGLVIGWFVGTKRVNRRSVFGDDYAGSPNHRRIMARRHFVRLISTFLYGLGGALVGFAFLLVTRRG